jgi:molybdate transport system substrate-binding protein
MQIQTRSVDAVIVWDAMARYYSEHGDQVAIPLEQNLISSVDIGVLSFAANEEPATRFVEFITSDRGRDIFEKHNYNTTPPQ